MIGPGERLAVEEGARACEAARSRAGPPAPPRAGDGRALARPRSRGGCQQPPPGSARRATRARPGGDRVAKRGALPRGRRSTSIGSSLRRPMHAWSRRRRPTVPRSRSMPASSCRRTGTTTGRQTRRDELAALVVELEQEFSAFGPTIGFGLPANTSSFVGRERELAELQLAAWADAAPHSLRYGRHGQDAARPRARPRRRAGVSRRAPRWSSSPS